MKCPHCNKEFTVTPPTKHSKELWELRYMIGRNWMWRGLIKDGRWKTDRSIPSWLEKGWIEMSEDGFRITQEGSKIAKQIDAQP